MVVPQQGAGHPCFIVRKRKFDGSIKSEWQGALLPCQAEAWLMILHHPERHLKLLRGTVERFDLLFLHAFHLVEPLAVLMEYDRDGQFRGAKCDAALPARREGKVVEFIDLDLDLMVEPDLACSVRDEAQFVRNREVMGYPQRVVQAAFKGLALARALVASQLFPFDERFVPRIGAELLRMDDGALPR